MTIRKTIQGYEISDIINGYRVHKLYIGYTKREAIALFRNEYFRKNPMTYRRYLVALDADQGRFMLEVIASSKKAAKQMVMSAEGCPASAIRSITPSPKRRR